VKRLTRRRLLAVSGLSLVGALGGGVRAIQPHRERRAPQGRKPRFERAVKVAVVGGGLAGMSAALELAERGAEVTLYEASPHLGGKLGGWPVRALGETWPMEHGFHGFFAQYYNLKDVLRRLGAWEGMLPATTYPLLSRTHGEDVFRRGVKLFPFNLLDLYARSPNLRFAPLLKAGPRMEALLAYNPTRTYAELDAIDFETFCKDSGMDPALAETMLIPFAKTTLNRPAVTSAAHVLRFMHFYFLGNPDGLSYEYPSLDSMAAVIDPWAARLRAFGVRIETGTSIRAIACDGDRAKGVITSAASAESRVAHIGGALSETPQKIREDFRGAPVFAWKHEGVEIAVRGACTHQGCHVAPTSDGFLCPCHGGRFDLRGEPIAGPPKRALERLKIIGQDVFAPAVREEIIAADHVVLASDAAASRKIVLASDVPQTFRKEAESLDVADPYLIVRVWLDRRANRDRAGFYTTTGYDLLDSIAVYENLQPLYQTYSQRSGNAVFELHAYAMEPRLLGSVEQNVAKLMEEFFEALPELRGARVLHQEVQQQQNFSGFGLASHARRPRTETALQNVFCAGDWVRTDLPVALMEAAVTTGRLAANAICAREDVAGAEVETVAMHGVLG
jgi:carotenoid phi-ring synthase / carotenoid chi-ring synthase